MILAGFDLETTGLDPAEHRIVEVYAGLWDLSTKTLIREFLQRIDPQRSILADASRVHGIYAGDLVGCPVFADVAGRLRHELSAANFLVAHNGVSFDLPFVNAELKRVGLPPIEMPVVDTMLLSRGATFDGKLPNLGELCQAYGVDYDPEKAHGAAYDVEVMVQCLFRGLDWGYLKLPETEAIDYVAAA